MTDRPSPADPSHAPPSNLPDAVSEDVWTDHRGKEWTITQSHERIVLSADDGAMEIPRARWPHDIQITRHGDGCIVRFETFDCSAVFLLDGDTTTEFANRLAVTNAQVDESTDDSPEPDRPPAAALLWPKVSPLAVWALICASLAFVPLIGAIPALSAIFLLAFHRAKVRRSQAYAHSRAICRAALVTLAIGLVVSTLASFAFFEKLKENSPGQHKNEGASRRAHARMIDERHEDVVAQGMDFGLVDSPPMSSPDLRVRSGGRTLVAQSPFSIATNVNWTLVILQLVIFIISLSVHECAHAITAWWLGDDFPLREGRVTLNPVSHVHLFGTILLPLLIAVHTGGFGFAFARPVQVRLDYVNRPRRANILISLAGPGSNLLQAAISFALLLGIGAVLQLWFPNAKAEGIFDATLADAVIVSGCTGASMIGPVCTLLKWIFFSNVVLAVFNMVPLPPLDGSWVLQGFFPNTIGRFFEAIRPYSLIIFIVAINLPAFDALVVYPSKAVLMPAYLILEFCTAFG
jgi:Zn-dependent protease